MKRKSVTILICCAALSLVAGCGGTKDGSGTDTEAVSLEESTESGTGFSTASSAITYNVDDYVTLGDYMDVEITLNEADYQVTDEKVNEYVDQMLVYSGAYVPDESKTVVEAGDVVDVNYVGKKDGVAFDGGTAENQIIDTGSNSSPSTGSGYIEGFSDGLIGVSVGETVDWDVTFPEDYQSEELKGQAVTFTFTVNHIVKAVTRESLDDSYVKENFGTDTVEAFYADVRNFLEQQAQQGREADIRSKVIEAVVAKCTVNSFPEGLVEARLEEYVEGFQAQYCSDGTDFSEFLMSNYNVTEEEFRSQNKTYLEQNLTEELVFEAIVKNENISFDQEAYDTYIANIVSNGSFASEEALYENYGPDAESGKAYLQKVYLENEACTLIADHAKITEAATDTEAAASTEE